MGERTKCWKPNNTTNLTYVEPLTLTFNGGQNGSFLIPRGYRFADYVLVGAGGDGGTPPAINNQGCGGGGRGSVVYGSNVPLDIAAPIIYNVAATSSDPPTSFSNGPIVPSATMVANNIVAITADNGADGGTPTTFGGVGGDYGGGGGAGSGPSGDGGQPGTGGSGNPGQAGSNNGTTGGNGGDGTSIPLAFADLSGSAGTGGRGGQGDNINGGGGGGAGGLGASSLLIKAGNGASSTAIGGRGGYGYGAGGGGSAGGTSGGGAGAPGVFIIRLY